MQQDKTLNAILLTVDPVVIDKHIEGMRVGITSSLVKGFQVQVNDAVGLFS